MTKRALFAKTEELNVAATPRRDAGVAASKRTVFATVRRDAGVAVTIPAMASRAIGGVAKLTLPLLGSLVWCAHLPPERRLPDRLT